MSIRMCESFLHALHNEPNEYEFREAVRLLRKDKTAGLAKLEDLARIGSPLSMYFIGEAYLSGDGFPRDVEHGMEWLRRSSDAGSIEAAYQLARSYWALDQMDKAESEFLILSRRGFSPAMYNLAQMHYFGEYLPKNLQLAKKYYQLASSHGHIIASKDLSLIYMKGVFGFYNILPGFIHWILACCRAIRYMIIYPESDQMRRR